MSRRIDPWWYVIALVLLLAGGLYVYHLVTGVTPPRAAFLVFGVPVYWYGIWIVTGVALGAWVVAGLAAERVQRTFEAAVPPDVRARLLAETGLSDGVVALLESRKIGTLGRLLMDVGLDPRRLGLKKAQTAEVVARPVLIALPSIVSLDTMQHGIALPYVTNLLTPPLPYEHKPLPGTSYLELAR